jgi:hypothetical protein
MNEKNLALFLILVLFVAIGWYIPALVVVCVLGVSLIQIEPA